MVVTCPNCRFSRPMDLSRLPGSAKKLACPRCRTQFDLPAYPETPERRRLRIRKRPQRAGKRKTTKPPHRADRASGPPDFVPTPKTPPPLVLEPPADERVSELKLTIDEEWDMSSAADVDSDSLAVETESAGRGGVPWEDNKASFVRGYIPTVFKVLLQPKKFFQTMPTDAGFKLPRKFAVTTLFIIGLVWAIQFAGDGLTFLELSVMEIVPPVLVLVIALPLVYGIFIFIEAAILHLLLVSFKAVEGGYQATFRVLAYSASAKLWLLAPRGWMTVALIWTVILYISGLRQAHEKKMNWAGLVIPVILAALEIWALTAVWSNLLYFNFFKEFADQFVG